MHFKKITSLAVASCMALSAMMMSAGAVDVENTSVAPGIELQAVTPSVNVGLNEYQSSQIINWPVYEGYGHWKIMVKNLSTSTMQLRIHKGSPTGPQVGSTMVIPAMQQLSFYCDENTTLTTGAYYLDITTDGTCNLKGNIYYKFGDSCASVL